MRIKKIPKCFFVVSRYKEDVSWIKKYTSNYVVYNKGPKLFDYNSMDIENIGGNQYDIFHFIYENYDNLPDLIAFVQAFPFDHCKKEIFDKLICNETFTPLEYYGSAPANSFEKRDFDGGFMEINNSWYIASHNKANKQTCKYSSLDEFMNTWFKNYRHVDWVRFSPGSQYLIEKKRAVHYPRIFWKKLMKEISALNTTEAHIVERALWMILQCTLELRK